MASLEQDVADLRKFAEVAARLQVSFLRCLVDKLVDERVISSDMRTQVWNDFEREAAEHSASSEQIARIMGDAIRQRRPPVPLRPIERERRPLLQSRKDTDEAV